MKITEQAITDGLKRVKYADQLKRQREARRYIDYYNYRQHDDKSIINSYMVERISKMFPVTASDLLPYIRTFPVTEQITNDASILFNNPPSLRINPSDKLADESPLVQLFQAEIVDKPMLMANLIQINRYTTLLNKIAVMPKWYEAGKQIEYVLLTPDKLIVLQDPDSPQHINAVLYPVDPLQDTIGYIQAVNEYIMITDEEWATVKLNGNRIQIIKSDVNPYGFIPVSWFQNSMPIDGFWIDKGNPIVEANESYNVAKTLEKLAITYQMYSTLVTIDLPADNQITWGVKAVLNLQGDPTNSNIKPDAKYITPDPKLTEVSEIIENEINAIAGYAGLSKEAYRNETNAFTSGYHLELSKQEVINNAELEKPFYTAAIKDLIMKACKVFTYHNKIKTLDGVNDITIDYQPLTFKRNPIEVWQVRVLEKQNGIKSAIDFIMEDNPDLTREEAEQIYERVKADNGSFTADIGKINADLGIK